MKSRAFTFNLCTASAIALAAISGRAAAQTPRANGETVGIQTYASATGNMHAIIAKEKGFCDKYNFKCEIKILNSTSLGLQALVGKSIDFTHSGADPSAQRWSRALRSSLSAPACRRTCCRSASALTCRCPAATRAIRRS